MGSCACVLGEKEDEDRLYDLSWTAGLKTEKDLSRTPEQSQRETHLAC